MDEKQINEAIARHLGWTVRKALNSERVAWFHPDGTTASEWHDKIADASYCLPNYCNDLNAMHEALLTLTKRETWDVYANLVKVVDPQESADGDTNHECIFWWMIVATARQLAEAFLRTVGKWKED